MLYKTRSAAKKLNPSNILYVISGTNLLYYKPIDSSVQTKVLDESDNGRNRTSYRPILIPSWM